jgi:hypothetical protein
MYVLELDSEGERDLLVIIQRHPRAEVYANVEIVVGGEQPQHLFTLHLHIVGLKLSVGAHPSRVDCEDIVFLAEPTKGSGDRDDRVECTTDVGGVVGVDDTKIGLVTEVMVSSVLSRNQESN